MKKWCNSPTSLTFRSEWKKTEAIKKRHIIAAKKEAWSSFISNLGPQDQPRLWSFTRSMLGKGSNLSPDGAPIMYNGTTINCLKENTDLVHNSMLRNLSPKNKTYFFHLVNILFSMLTSQRSEKKSIVLPLLNRARIPRTHPPTAQYLSHPV